MTLKINNNPAVINAHRNLLIKDKQINKTLEKISTGLDIVRGADGPASLVLSEQLRSQIVGLQQAVSNAEIAVSMVQTTEAALEEVSRLLINLRKLAVHASNDAANDKLSLQADQYEVENILQTLDRISEQTSFGSRKLLDGSGTAYGSALGNGLEFISGNEKTKDSPEEGYEVKVIESATKAFLISDSFIDTEYIDLEDIEAITITENARAAKYAIKNGEKIAGVVANLNSLMKENGIDITASIVKDDQILFEHNQYGSNHNFSVSSTSEGFISDDAGQPKQALDGTDITGSIGGYSAIGKGNVLHGSEGSPTDGLQVSYFGELEDYDADGITVGKLLVKQNSLLFQLGASHEEIGTLSLAPTYARYLGRNIVNDSSYKSIADIDLRTFQGAQDALKLVVAASNSISETRSRLGAFQKNSLEATANYLRNSVENIVASESIIRDADIAEKSAELIRNEIQAQSASLATLHASNSPKLVVGLLGAVQN